MNKQGNQEFVKQFECVCADYADKTAIAYLHNDGSKEDFTFNEIFVRVQLAKEQFKSAGLCSGDRVAIIAPHSPFAVFACFALAYANITSVLIDATLPPEEINRLLHLADVRAIFTVQDVFKGLCEETIKDIPVFDLMQEDDCKTFDGIATRVLRSATTDPDLDVIAVIYSSGTTDSMKGIMITYQSVLKSREIYLINTGLTSDMNYLSVLPFNHIAGFSGTFQYFLTGCELDMIERVDVTKLQGGLLEFKPDFFAMVPKVYEVMEQKIRQTIHEKGSITETFFNAMLSLSGFLRRNTGIKIGKYIFHNINQQVFGGRMHGLGTGSSLCDESITKFFLDLGYDWANFYSTTETNVPAACTGILDRYPVNTVGHIERFDDIKIEVRNPDENGIGEIRVKTSLIMKGYFREPELTATAFDEDGYFKTGDLGYIDKKGYLHVTGRIKEAIHLHNGKKVAPSDVDSLYNTLCPDVLLASCGVPSKDNAAFDEIHMFVESSGIDTSRCEEIQKEIMKFSAQTGLTYKISSVHFIGKIPITSIGKIKRYKLKKIAIGERMAEHGNSAPSKSACGNVKDAVLNIIASHTDSKAISLADRLKYDLGVDSLTMLEICVDIESAFNTPIADNMGAVDKVRDIVMLVEKGSAVKRDVDYEIKNYPLPKSKKHLRQLKLFMRLSRLVWRFDISGLENIPTESIYILCPNHQSHFDSLWVWSAIGEKAVDLNKICCLAKQEHLSDKHSAFMLPMLGGIPVDRSGNTIPAMRRGLACIKHGYTMLIHPEGTRTRDGQMHEFKGGAARLAIDASVPLIPVCIDGAWDIFPPHKKHPKIFRWGGRYPLKISFGKPIEPDGKSVEELTAILYNEVAQLRNTK